MTEFTFRFQEKSFNLRVNTNSTAFKHFKDWIKNYNNLEIQASQRNYELTNFNRLRACRIKAMMLNLEASIIE